MKIINFKGNKVVVNKLLPIEGFFCMNIFGVFFIREDNAKYFSDEYINNSIIRRTINHESIHTEQMKDWFGWIGKKWRNSTVNTILGGVVFYIVYFIEWLIRLITPPIKSAYSDISFEQEAYLNQGNYDYISNRKPFAWTKRLFKSHNSK